nr:MAG TPA: minor capsid protein [Caudoviricetes sp.]
MALSEKDIDELVESLVHGYEEQYVAELTETIVQEFADGFTYSAETDLLTLSKKFPNKANVLLLKYRDKISKQVQDEIAATLSAANSADMAALAAIYKTVDKARKLKATMGAEELTWQTAKGVADIIKRQNVALSASYQAAWYNVTTETVTAVNQGLKSREKALADGVVKLMNTGIQVIPYQKNGKSTITNHVDVALRRHITTQVSQAGGRMSLDAMDLYNHDLVITDAHYGARESHAYWQGIPCCRSGQKTIDGETYPDMVSLTEYGSVTGLKGANCRHMIFPYFPGITPLPDREFKAQQEKFGMTSNEYYQATQRQRELERHIRKTKREVAGLEQAGIGFENPTYVNKRLLLGKQQSTLKSFCKENNLARLYEREKAYGIIKQPRALTGAKWTTKERGISKKKMSLVDAKVSPDLVNSKEFKAKFNNITGNPKVDRQLYEHAKAALTHRSGTYGEDLYLVSIVDGSTKLAHTSSKEYLGVTPTSDLHKAIKDNAPGTLFSVHNHPSNVPPTGSDFSASEARQYAGSIVALHNGGVYYYKHGHSSFTAREFDTSVKRRRQKGLTEHTATIATLEEFSRRFGIQWKKL